MYQPRKMPSAVAVPVSGFCDESSRGVSLVGRAEEGLGRSWWRAEPSTSGPGDCPGTRASNRLGRVAQTCWVPVPGRVISL